MAQQTQLTVYALPGRTQSFVGKAAVTSGPHTGGPFTQLQPYALPGQIHSFVAKTAVTSGPHTGGPFTQLNLMAAPGMRYSFLAKTEAKIVGGKRYFVQTVYRKRTARRR
jgi:hypothetical protein